MKNWKKIFSVIVVLVVVFTFAYTFFIVSAKSMFSERLSSAFGRKTTIGRLMLRPPLNLELTDLNIESFAKIGYIYVSPSIPYLFTGKLALNKVRIVDPKIFCERRLPPAPEASAPAGETGSVPAVPDAQASKEEASPAPAAPADNAFKLIIKSLKIRSGEIDFVDHVSDSKEVEVVIKNIDVNLRDLYTYPVDRNVNFDLSGRLPWKSEEPEGKIYMYGWLNPYKKDMLVNLTIDGIDAIAFYPYYSTWVDLEKARIEKAKLNFNSKITGDNNDVSAQCHLELADIVRKPRSPDEPQQKAERLTDAVLGMFKAMNQGKVMLDFTLHTKMDHPQFGFENIKAAFEGKLMEARSYSGLRPQDVLLWPGKLLQGGIRSGSDLSKAAIDGVFALGNGMKKFFEDVMNKQTPTK